MDPAGQMLAHRALRLGDRTVRGIMRPRIEIDALDVDTPADEVIGAVAMAGFSRLPIHEGDLDHIIGFVYTKDLLLRQHVIDRSHHCIADGMALVGVMLSLCDERPDSPSKFHMPPAGLEDEEGLGFPVRQIVNLASQTVGQGFQLSGKALRASMGMLANPMKALGYLNDGRGIATELGYLLLMPTDTPTRFKGKPSGVKRVAWTDPLPLPEVKAVGHALGCSINDILLASVAGSLHGYLKEHGAETSGVEIRALVPINLRKGADEPELGNRFGILAVELPVGIEQPLERLYEVRRRMEELKRSYEPPVTLGLFAALGSWAKNRAGSAVRPAAEPRHGGDDQCPRTPTATLSRGLPMTPDSCSGCRKRTTSASASQFCPSMGAFSSA